MPTNRHTRAALAVTLIALFSAAEARPQDFDGFRIPDSRTLQWSGSFSGRASRHHETFWNISEHATSFYGSMYSRLAATRDSDPARSSWSGSVRLDGSRGTDRVDMAYPPVFTPWGFTEATGEQLDTSVQVNLLDRRYPWRARFGYELAVAGVYQSRHGWDSFRADRSESLSIYFRRIRDSETSEDEFESRSIAASLTLGFGRVRDATPVADAWILEQRLAKAGALARPLSRDTRERLAALLATRPAFGAVLERPARSLWKEIAAVLAADGALSEAGMEAFDILHAGEPVFPRESSARDLLPSSPISRQRGWFAGPAIAIRHSSTWQRQGYARTNEYTLDSLTSTVLIASGDQDRTSLDEVTAHARGEYHVPVGERWQFDGATDLMLPARDEQRGVVHHTNAVVSWLVHDQWLVTVHLDHRRDHRKPIASWRADYGASVRYFIEDRMSIGVSADEFQSRFRHYDHFDFHRDAGVNLTLDYQFLGRIAAPALVAPLHTPLDDLAR